MRITALLTALGALAVVAGCADNDPVDTGFGTASAVVADDPNSTSAYRTSDGAAYRTMSDSHFSGSFSSNAEVAVSADGETWVDLGSPSSVLLDLQTDGEESTIHANASVPVGTYTRVRLSLSGAEANIDSGATLGGITFTGAISMQVGGTDGDVVIEKEVEPFTVSSDTHVRILFDLNSELWVNQQNADDEEVEDEEVEDSAGADREVEQRENQT